ncbi:hypothetical protein [Mycobacterium kansasii]
MSLLTRRKPAGYSAFQSDKSDAATPILTANSSPESGFSPAEPSPNTQNGGLPMLDDDHDHPFWLVPLAQLVAEGFDQSIDNLAKRLADAVLFNDVGQRCVTRATAASLFAERAAKQEIERRRRAERSAEARRRREEKRLRREAEEAKRQPPPPPPGAWRGEYSP